MRVRFTQDCEMRDHNDIVAVSFTSGQVADLTPDQARRWIRRDKAEPVSEVAAPLEQETTPAVEPEPEPVTEDAPKSGEAESQPDTGSEAGEETQQSSSQADQASRSGTLKLSGSGKQRRRRHATSS